MKLSKDQINFIITHAIRNKPLFKKTRDPIWQVAVFKSLIDHPNGATYEDIYEYVKEYYKRNKLKWKSIFKESRKSEIRKLIKTISRKLKFFTAIYGLEHDFGNLFISKITENNNTLYLLSDSYEYNNEKFTSPISTEFYLAQLNDIEYKMFEKHQSDILLIFGDLYTRIFSHFVFWYHLSLLESNERESLHFGKYKYRVLVPGLPISPLNKIPGSEIFNQSMLDRIIKLNKLVDTVPSQKEINTIKRDYIRTFDHSQYGEFSFALYGGKHVNIRNEIKMNDKAKITRFSNREIYNSFKNLFWNVWYNGSKTLDGKNRKSRIPKDVNETFYKVNKYRKNEDDLNRINKKGK